MGALPKSSDSGLSDGRVPHDSKFLPTLSQSPSRAAESIRTLRTHIMARHLAMGRRALAICATSAKTGCTFVAVNLAVALSQSGANTLLIDADLRNPKIHKIFGRPAPQGLQQYLGNSNSLPDELIEYGVLPKLSLLSAGGATPNPGELLASSRLNDLMDFCVREFDATIVDTPPANTSSDIGRICSVGTYCTIVARRNRSFVSDVKLLAEQLRADGAHVIGTVLCEG